jgi:divalent metal cation (Fe/Co/Zn/Cd) transporter
MILYATFAITTGIIIGYVSLAVGWMVGNAILKGSGGVGGRRYQITAVLLTYCAVSMAAVPIWIHYAAKQKQAQEQDLAARQRQLENEFGQQGRPVTPTPNNARPSMASGLAMLALIGIASPFIEIWEAGPNFGTMIGIVILIVGIRIAWRITAGRPLEIYGPFTNSRQPTS